ncbi:MAG: alpha/beta hydrolase [Gammaproteobacteria bacterium]|nr:MAG: alpha/beta hydrolase [Gammaproteobacteria bacterium]
MTDLKLHEGRLKIGGLELEVIHKGSGQPMLLLHGGGGPLQPGSVIDQLAERFEVIAPTHPGFGNTARPAHITKVDDLSYLYLDLLDQYDLQDVILVGFSIGGWTAVEIAVKNSSRLSRLMMVGAVGIKQGDRETRDFPDMFAIPPDELAALAFHDPAKAQIDFSTLSDEQLTAFARNRESLALYAWEPYLHNPKLKQRLHRIQIPTNVCCGASDGLVSPAYSEGYAGLIAGATFDTIAEAGHAPQMEQPQRFVDWVLSKTT